jgi:hypothetical protein
MLRAEFAYDVRHANVCRATRDVTFGAPSVVVNECQQIIGIPRQDGGQDKAIGSSRDNNTRLQATILSIYWVAHLTTATTLKWNLKDEARIY